MRLTVAIMILAAAGALALPSPAHAQEHHSEADAAGEAFHKNHLSLFTGGTTEPRDGETSTSFSLGVDYERRLSRLVGLAGGGELVFGGDEREALVGLYLLLHVTEGLVLAAGPGLEFAKEGHAEGGVEAQQEESGTETHPGLRIGILYHFEVGRQHTIAPSIYTDFIEGKQPTFVWGLAFGLGF